jgi:benzodiazapine receptor
MTALASRGQLRLSLLRYALVTVPLVLLLGTIFGRISNAGSDNPWFAALAKPDFMPAGWLFGAAWTILYVLLGLALALLLHARGARRRGRAIALFVLQLVLNYFWPPFFFGWHQIGWALVLIGATIALTIVLIVLLWSIRRLAALLVLPYLAWLCFAGMLTFSIWTLNPDPAEVAPQPATTDIVL